MLCGAHKNFEASFPNTLHQILPSKAFPRKELYGWAIMSCHCCAVNDPENSEAHSTMIEGRNPSSK